MIIQHNVASANTNRQLGITNGNISKSTEKLSSGYKINRAGDDAAGLSISEKMRAQIRGLETASKNSEDGISMIQTAEGALNEIHSILQRTRELAVQSANDTNVSADRLALQKELNALISEVTRIACQTEFNTMKLLQGNFTLGLASGGTDVLGLDPGTNKTRYFHVGANSGQVIKITISDCRAGALGLTTKNNPGVTLDAAAAGDAGDVNVGRNISVTGHNKAEASIRVINCAIEKISATRSGLGALQNRLEHTIANADNTAENLQAAESRIRDVDMAKEMVTYSKDGILQQAAQSMLAQANQSTQGVLALLQ